MKTSKNYQSWGMPLTKDLENGGTENDGSKSVMYCSYCFKDGVFTTWFFGSRYEKSSVKGEWKKWDSESIIDYAKKYLTENAGVCLSGAVQLYLGWIGSTSDKITDKVFANTWWFT